MKEMHGSERVKQRGAGRRGASVRSCEGSGGKYTYLSGYGMAAMMEIVSAFFVSSLPRIRSEVRDQIRIVSVRQDKTRVTSKTSGSLSPQTSDLRPQHRVRGSKWRSAGPTELH